MLASRGCKLTVLPAQTHREEVLALKPDGVFLSNGPGDPEPCDYAIRAIREFLDAGVPTFGICLGHQLLGLASGAKTIKMKFGHHGANHPVQDLETGRVMITSQNHGFAVDAATLPANCASRTSRCSTAACRASPAPTSRRSVSRAIPKRARVRTTSTTCSTGSSDDGTAQGASIEPDRTNMPKRTDIKSVLIIGAGPIVIGQACEFDYSGAQACKALREEGYRVILVNSNPATIMTDPEMADATYIEPITWQMVEKIIAIERPDALLPTMGGQTALNCALDLARHGVLEKYGVEMIGATRRPSTRPRTARSSRRR